MHANNSHRKWHVHVVCSDCRFEALHCSYGDVSIWLYSYGDVFIWPKTMDSRKQIVIILFLLTTLSLGNICPSIKKCVLLNLHEINPYSGSGDKVVNFVILMRFFIWTTFNASSASFLENHPWVTDNAFNVKGLILHIV